MSSGKFILITLAVAAAVFVAAQLVSNNYLFFAGYVVLQFVVLATAWNILGGYCGYVNFGSAAFFAVGAYSSVFMHKTYQLPLPLLILLAGAVAGFVGLGMGYLTLRLRGSFFAIATLALAVVLQTLVVNWDFVGGSRGAYVIRPNALDVFGQQVPYIEYLFLLMLTLAVVAIVAARTIEHSRLGYGFATIRDDELAAEASGVPTLRLKLIATTLSGALMGMAGAPFPYYIGYLQPSGAFGLEYAVNSIAMPMIGGTGVWIGPVLGAVLLGSLQQVATVTISSAVNLLIVGLLLVDCVIIAPNGLVGLIRERRIASTVVEPTVFALLYTFNVAPTYFLTGQGQGPQSIGLVFWAILAFVAYERGRHIGRLGLILFPIIGAVLSMLPVDAVGQTLGIVLHPNAIMWANAILQLVGVLSGLMRAQDAQAQWSDGKVRPENTAARNG